MILYIVQTLKPFQLFKILLKSVLMNYIFCLKNSFPIVINYDS